jgi:hypothetical protein
MIDIKQLNEEDRGRRVEYNNGFRKETGVIKSWNENVIFVVFKCDEDWGRYMHYTGCATNPEDLIFV